MNPRDNWRCLGDVLTTDRLDLGGSADRDYALGLVALRIANAHHFVATAKLRRVIEDAGRRYAMMAGHVSANHPHENEVINRDPKRHADPRRDFLNAAQDRGAVCGEAQQHSPNQCDRHSDEWINGGHVTLSAVCVDVASVPQPFRAAVFGYKVSHDGVTLVAFEFFAGVVSKDGFAERGPRAPRHPNWPHVVNPKKDGAEPHDRRLRAAVTALDPRSGQGESFTVTAREDVCGAGIMLHPFQAAWAWTVPVE